LDLKELRASLKLVAAEYERSSSDRIVITLTEAVVPSDRSGKRRP
jgi:hypothetical protein